MVSNNIYTPSEDGLYYTIYQTTNLINGKIYIGQHKTKNLQDGYLGSGKLISESIKKYGKEQFKKEILFCFDNFEDMNSKEIEIVDKEFINEDFNYNLATGGNDKKELSGKTLKKMSQNNSGKNNPFYGRKHSDESKEKSRKKQIGKLSYNYGRIVKKETRNKIGERHKGKKLSKEHKLALSKAMIGENNPNSGIPKEETSMFGKKHSEESKRKISESKKGKMWIHNKITNKGKFILKTEEIPEGWGPGRGATS